MKQMKISKRITGMLVASLVLTNLTQAQETDTVAGVLERISTDVSQLKNLKISGYFQVIGQWIEKQDDQSFKVPSAAGGDFGSYMNDRFGVRRGRLKFAYSASPLSQAVVQFDATEKGMGLKDAYIKVTEPFVKFVCF